MGQGEQPFPFKKFTYVFMLMNVLLFVPLFFSYVWSPGLGFETFKHYWVYDPDEIIKIAFIGASVLLAGVFLSFKKYVLSFFFAFLPEMAFLILIVLAGLSSLFS